ncbi:MAG: transglutaminase domain-containing protein [Bacteroidetes bacterium]|nr:transglutaminase domain-containing protein [Bacteroidota bacterium]
MPQQKEKYDITKSIIAQVAGLLIIIPLAPFICRYIPPVMISGFNIDLILSILISILIVRILMALVKPLVLPILLVFLGILGFNQFSGHYGFTNIFNDYKTLTYTNWTVREHKQNDILEAHSNLFENEADKVSRLVKSKIQYNDSVTRNFSVQHSLDYFKEYESKYSMLTRYLSLFKYINNHFNYVPDSQRDEYYASPRETILNGLGGDCDDHSILMASCLMSIGAQCRLVIVENHMYPELYVGNKENFEILQQAIIQLFSDQKINRLYYHESNGDYWINLDYTAHYPGGPYMNDHVKLVIEP